jgi:aspartyl-tRNA(Asn)/glutamyl-tRNA(Gln) amidotransferase subunit A
MAQAMEAALAVYRRLGATIEDVRLRPLQDYVDVKMAIGETEIFCVHHKDLIARPGDFGAPFLSQTLAGCLFEATDYVQAQRERRLMLAEMEPLYRKHDVLVTSGSGPAPRFDQFSVLNSWIRPNIYNVFNVTGGPCIAVCIGFTPGGLPLSMQVGGRPFDDATVLRAAYAYEQATGWRRSRPKLAPHAPRVEVSVPPVLSGKAVDEATCRIAEQHARHAD